MAQTVGVISHWYHGVADYSTSAKEFYAKVELAVAKREIPGARTERIEHAEGGVLSAKRVYLRVSREKLTFDICAAPFGTGFFFSWWLSRQPANPLMALVGCGGLVIAPAIVVAILSKVFHAPFSLLVLAVPATWWLMGTAVRAGAADFQETVIDMPGIGPVFEFLFRPTTYYRIDTMLMFQEAVSSAVLEVLDSMQSEQGLRALSPDERLPKMRDLAR